MSQLVVITITLLSLLNVNQNDPEGGDDEVLLSVKLVEAGGLEKVTKLSKDLDEDETWDINVPFVFADPSSVGTTLPLVTEVQIIADEDDFFDDDHIDTEALDTSASGTFELELFHDGWFGNTEWRLTYKVDRVEVPILGGDDVLSWIFENCKEELERCKQIPLDACQALIAVECLGVPGQCPAPFRCLDPTNPCPPGFQCLPTPIP